MNRVKIYKTLLKALQQGVDGICSPNHQLTLKDTP